MTIPATRAEFARQDPARIRPHAAYRLSFLRLVASEWIKLSTLRSPWWSIGIVAVLSIGISLLLAWALSGVVLDSGAAALGGSTSSIAVQTIIQPTTFTVLLATILGSIQVTGEYSTGMIRSTLTAAPGRIGSLLAKTLVMAGFVFAASIVIFVIAAAATAPLLSRADIALDLSDPGASILPLLAGALTMAVITVIGVSAGYVLRNGPGAIALGVGLVFVLPIVPAFFAAIPSAAWVGDLARYLPTNAGQALMTPSDTSLTVPIALLTLGAWVVAGLVGGIAVLRSRDA